MHQGRANGKCVISMCFIIEMVDPFHEPHPKSSMDLPLSLGRPPVRKLGLPGFAAALDFGRVNMGLRRLLLADAEPVAVFPAFPAAAAAAGLASEAKRILPPPVAALAR